MKYKAYLVEENEGTFQGSIKEIEMQSIEPGNLIIKVHYSSLNYKDALAASGVKGVASSYPFVPGIDVSGGLLHHLSASDAIRWQSTVPGAAPRGRTSQHIIIINLPVVV